MILDEYHQLEVRSLRRRWTPGRMSAIAEMEQKGSNSIRNGRALGSQHAVTAHLHALHFHHVSEFGSVAYLNLQERDWVIGRKVVIFSVF